MKGKIRTKSDLRKLARSIVIELIQEFFDYEEEAINIKMVDTAYDYDLDPSELRQSINKYLSKILKTKY